MHKSELRNEKKENEGWVFFGGTLWDHLISRSFLFLFLSLFFWLCKGSRTLLGAEGKGTQTKSSSPKCRVERREDQEKKKRGKLPNNKTLLLGRLVRSLHSISFHINHYQYRQHAPLSLSLSIYCFSLYTRFHHHDQYGRFLVLLLGTFYARKELTMLVWFIALESKKVYYFTNHK